MIVSDVANVVSHLSCLTLSGRRPLPTTVCPPSVHRLIRAPTGKPTPSVHWYRDNVLIDSSSSIVDESVVRNELIVSNIVRTDLNSIYSCHAINNNSSQTVAAFVTFDIYGQIYYINLYSSYHWSAH